MVSGYRETLPRKVSPAETFPLSLYVYDATFYLQQRVKKRNGRDEF